MYLSSGRDFIRCHSKVTSDQLMYDEPSLIEFFYRLIVTPFSLDQLTPIFSIKHFFYATIFFRLLFQLALLFLFFISIDEYVHNIQF